MDKKCKRATVGSSREIWCSNRETGRFHEKLGDSRENRESWQVCNQLHTSQLGYKVETAVHGFNLAFSLDSIVSLPR